MSHIKENIDQSSKGKLYQTKVVSDKNVSHPEKMN